MSQDSREEDEAGSQDASFGRLLPGLLAQLAALPDDARFANMTRQETVQR